MSDVFVLTAQDRTGTANEVYSLYGVYSTHEKATDAILYWMFENKEKAESYEDDWTDTEKFITDKTIWKLEKIEIDFVI